MSVLSHLSYLSSYTLYTKIYMYSEQKYMYVHQCPLGSTNLQKKRVATSNLQIV